MGGEAKNQKPFTRLVKAAVRKVKAPSSATAVSQQGLGFIAHFEGCPLNPDGTLRVYNDPWNATVGVGHLIHMGKYTAADVAKYAGWRYKDALNLLRSDVLRYEGAVKSIGVKLAQNEFDALVSLAFNCGPGAVQGGVASSLRKGDRVGAMNVLREYCRANGQILPGLVTRRAAEAALFLHGKYV